MLLLPDMEHRICSNQQMEDKTGLILDHDEDDQANCNPHGKTRNIDQGIVPMAKQVPEGSLEVTPDHKQLVFRLNGHNWNANLITYSFSDI